MAMEVMSTKKEPLDLTVNIPVAPDSSDKCEAGENEAEGADPCSSETLPTTETVFIKIEREDFDYECYEEPSSTTPDEAPPPHEYEVKIKQENITVHVTPCLDADELEELALAIPRERRADYSEEVLSAKMLPNGKFPCPVCGMEVATRNSLHRHMETHAKQRNTCKFCPQEFPDLATLELHYKSDHSDIVIYQCDQCEKFFKTFGNLQQHKRVHLPVKPFNCEICLKSFSVKSNFDRHKLKNSCKVPLGKLECTICNKEFRREYLYKSHLKKHEADRPFDCKQCDMSFKFKSTLVRHMQIHKDFKPFPCKVCGKKFTSRGLIKPHMRIHTGEKPFTCPICQKTFAHKHNMQRHSLRHDRIKNLVCEVCHKEFPKESRLKYHMRAHMEDNRPFKCEICPKSFSHRQNIIRHYKRKHPLVTYDRPETDASVANVIWETVLSQKMANEKDYILPEQDCDLKFSVEVKVENAEDTEAIL